MKKLILFLSMLFIFLACKATPSNEKYVVRQSMAECKGSLRVFTVIYKGSEKVAAWSDIVEKGKYKIIRTRKKEAKAFISEIKNK